MDWINSISNMDSIINGICIKDSCLTVHIKTWDQKNKNIRFWDYYGFKERSCFKVTYQTDVAWRSVWNHK